MLQTPGDHLTVAAAAFSSLSTGYANDPQCQKARLAEARRVTDACSVITILSVEIEARPFSVNAVGSLS